MITEVQRQILKQKNITYACFKMVISALLTKPCDFNEDYWVYWYECYAEQLDVYDQTIEEWAEEHFQDFTIGGNGTELRSRTNDWIDSNILPQENLGVLVYIPDEDHHITSGMWDISQKWVLLDDYREPNSKVTHWRILPEKP